MSNKNNKKSTQANSVTEKWNCKCGKKNIKSNFCPECGAKRKDINTNNMTDTDNSIHRLSKKTLIIAVVTAVLVIATIITGVVVVINKNNSMEEPKTQMLSFAQATSLSTMQELNGKQVAIIGYMSTLSPVNGQFMYLMNLPYQSCPFCIPNTTQLSNTIAVYAKTGDEFTFTDRAIQVTGILEFGSWKDEFGYEYAYRIKDAVFEILNTENMSEELKLWQALAAADVIDDIYSMYDYINFVCYWPLYTATFGSTQDYLYPADAAEYLKAGEAYEYGTKTEFYDDIISKIKAVDEDAFVDLIANIEKCKALAAMAKKDLEEEKYTVVEEYGGFFNDGRTQYKLNNYELYDKTFLELWQEFATWMAKWEV